MPEISLYCFSATPFAKSGELDETAYREFLQRFIDARIGLYLASGGGGEGHSLTIDELRRVYQIGVEECKGKIPVHANPPEQHTARMTIEHARLAIDAGIEVVHVYTLAGWHGMRPTDAELLAYFDHVFGEIKHPATVSVNPSMGYVPKPSVIAEICRRHRQVEIVKLTGVPDNYLVSLMDLISRKVSYHVQPVGSLNTMALGADTIFSTEANLIPKTMRLYLDSYLNNQPQQMARAYADLRRFDQYVRKWNPSIPRWIKMGMKVLKLPGGEGGPREPYRLPDDAEMAVFTKGLLALKVPEIDEQARAAGLI